MRRSTRPSTPLPTCLCCLTRRSSLRLWKCSQPTTLNAQELWVLGGGKIRRFDGDFAAYRQEAIKEAAANSQASSAAGW